MEVKNQDHRTIAENLDLYIFDEKAGQGLPILLPNWVIIRNQIQQFIHQKWIEYNFQEAITPILGSKALYKTSGHLSHYQDYMFPEISRNNETYYLRPMTCPHHCLIYQQKPRSYRELPFRLCENSLLFRYEASGAMKGLERIRWFELSEHHIFVSHEQLKEELKKNYRYIADILAAFNFPISRLVCALHDPNNSEKYHSDKELWKYSESVLVDALNELKLNYVVLEGEAAFYGPKLDLEITATDGKNITIATIQLDFILPQKFGLKYIDQEQNLKIPAIIHQSPIGSYQRFIALLLEQTNGKLPFWLAPIQLVILPINDQEEVKEYSENLQKKLLTNNFRTEIWLPEKQIKYQIKQTYIKKIPYYLVVGKEEIKNEKLKLTYTYSSPKKEIELTENELLEKLKLENSIRMVKLNQ
ncbi:threonine--tRNA ligase [endosymbiont GvMRE of Glomus versiforme]|uniref:threonine--tRNA ligase n=1 Tax=endosymbiont GvMRE of Glomus versiforme TaxID=2039283 RepID=UPI000ED51DCB|nr:threonine--tRNA ligase [endosymbiont GvMRE of Glomus versiforme]RHZ37142.1 Threonine--tRNA ligase [endosymbiont GvMRE of Glomus versiforme]